MRNSALRIRRLPFDKSVAAAAPNGRLHARRVGVNHTPRIYLPVGRLRRLLLPFSLGPARCKLLASRRNSPHIVYGSRARVCWLNNGPRGEGTDVSTALTARTSCVRIYIHIQTRARSWAPHVGRYMRGLSPSSLCVFRGVNSIPGSRSEREREVHNGDGATCVSARPKVALLLRPTERTVCRRRKFLAFRSCIRATRCRSV